MHIKFEKCHLLSKLKSLNFIKIIHIIQSCFPFILNAMISSKYIHHLDDNMIKHTKTKNQIP